MDDLCQRHGEVAAHHFTEGEELTVTTTDGYVKQVLDRIPQHLPLHGQVERELRSLFAERQARGQSEAQAAQELGDPLTLAESYLSATPMVSADFLSRVAAKLLDAVLFAIVMVPLLVVPFVAVRASWRENDEPGVAAFIFFMCLAFSSLLFWVGSAWAETRFSRTIGKKMLGLYVVRETGTRISFGQAVVRQLPIFLQVFMLDALFALFSERHQRAFEMLSRTRTVRDTAA
jgi:uncharacterized RDD family membrane protein YckC